MGRELNLRAYGKINLGLDVLCRRPDGYHEVRMIMQTVRLCDRISICALQKPGILLKTNLRGLPEDERNLAFRAAALLIKEFGLKQGISIHLEKRIPVAAGMAGGSADAAAVLCGVNSLFGLGLSEEELMARGVKLGADVPYCILRGTALAEGIGEKLSSLPPPPPCSVLIAKPAVSVSTRFVYENLHVDSLPPEVHPDIGALIDALQAGDISCLAGGLGNILETVTLRKYPVIGEIKKAMLADGALGALMSGSGPTVFGLFADAGQAGRAYGDLRYGPHAGLSQRVFLTDFWNPARPARRQRAEDGGWLRAKEAERNDIRQGERR